MQSSRLAFPLYESPDQAKKSKNQKALLRFEQLLDEPSRSQLASIGEFSVAEEGKSGLKITYQDLKDFDAGWAPMSMELMFDKKAKNSGFGESDKSAVLKGYSKIFFRYSRDTIACCCTRTELGRSIVTERKIHIRE